MAFGGQQLNSATDPWVISTTRGSAEGFHNTPMQADPHHSARICLIDAPSIVLGSTQSKNLIDLEAAAAEGIEVCKRRSGGGIVLLIPRQHIWVDIEVPRGSPLWVDDVGKAFHWLGHLWAGVLRSSIRPGGPRITVCTEPSRERHDICFAGKGHGEVFIESHKVVGLSQKRTRTATRFQCLCLAAWDTDMHLKLLNSDAPRAAATLDSVKSTVAGFPPEVSPKVGHEVNSAANMVDLGSIAKTFALELNQPPSELAARYQP